MTTEPNGNKALIPFSDEGVVIPDIDAAFRFARMYLLSGLAPAAYKNEQQIIVAMIRARELKVPYLQALEGMSVINGKIGLMGDLALALAERSGELEDKRIRHAGEGDELSCVLELKRKGREWKQWSFSVREAKQAGIFERSAVWRQYPKRMTYYRALGFALRDEFGDVLRGMRTTEELADYPEEPKRKGKYDLSKPALPNVLAGDDIDLGDSKETGEVALSSTPAAPEPPQPPEPLSLTKLRHMLQQAGIEESKCLEILASPLVRLCPAKTEVLENLSEETLRQVIEDFDGLQEMAKAAKAI